MTFILVSESRSSNDLQLMQFKRCQGKLGDLVGLTHKLIMALPGESQDDMPSNADASLYSSADCFLRLGKRVPSIDTTQRVVACTLYPILHQQKSSLVQLFQIIQQGIRHTVRTGPYDKPNDILHADCLLIQSPQAL